MAQQKPDLSGLEMLILDDSPSSLSGVEREFKTFGAQVFTATGVAGVKDILSRERVNVIIAPLQMADEACIEAVREYKALHPDTLFYLLTEHDYESIEPSLDSIRFIVDDYIQKPLNPLRFARMVETCHGRPCTGSTSLAIVEPIVSKVKPYFLFRSPAMRNALSNLPEIAASGQTVLISGETGTGKELVARAIHMLSSRSSGPFVPINCSAIPETLIEGELFGHEKGAFTGAHKTRRGKFESANNGTLFLDEIGDMPINLQTRLLRVLEENKIYRVGGEAPVHINVRVITATRVDLDKMARDGLFREDLYYRLNVLRIHLPPLRDRVEDVPLLAVHFLDRAFTEMGRLHPYPSLSSETIYLLERYPWRGNVRELRNVMTRVATLLPSDAKKVFPQHILPLLEDANHFEASPQQELQKGEGVFIPVGTYLDLAEELLIKEALKHTSGNRTQAAKLLGISLRTLRRKLNK